MNLSTNHWDRFYFLPAREVLRSQRASAQIIARPRFLCPRSQARPPDVANGTKRHDRRAAAIIGLKARDDALRGPRPSNEASQRAAREVQWLSATAVRQLSTATSITIPRCSGDVRAAEHGVFNGEGRGLTFYHATGRIAQRVRDAYGPDGAGVHLRVRTQLHEATLRDHRGRAAIQPDGLR